MVDVVCMSDTHMKHGEIYVPEGDILIHAGDAMSSGAYWQAREFVRWFREQPHRLKIYVPGNHDVCLMDRDLIDFDRLDEVGVHILIDRHFFDDETGLSFHGVPWTPDFFPNRWAFNHCQAGRTVEEIWGAVPDSTDVLISHGPPRGWGDQVLPGREHLGCPELAKTLSRVKPQLFVCGHIHGGYGHRRWDDTGSYWVNASCCTEVYAPTNPVFVVDIPSR